MEAPAEALQTPQPPASVQWRAMLFVCILILINACVYPLGWNANDTQALLIYMILGGGTMIAAILYILAGVCGELREELNLKPGSGFKDVPLGCLLGLFLTLQLIILELFSFLYWEILMESFFGNKLSRSSIESTFLGKFVNDPIQYEWIGLVLFLGPALLIGFAGFDELSRAFLLTRWMKVSTSKRHLWAGVFLSAALVGLSQLYLGLVGFLIGLFSGSILGAWYLYKGRIWQLIIARYVFTVAQYLHLFLFSFSVWMW